MARLRRAQQLTCAPNLQVAHGDLEAGAEFGVVADGVEALFRYFRQDLAPAEGQISIGVAAAAAHTPADLVELGQAHFVRVLDDEGVDVGDVDARLNDGGADQDLQLPVHHPLHHVRQLLLAHFAVGDADLGLRKGFFDPGGALGDGFDPVVQVVDLSAALQLPAHGVDEHRLGVFQHKGLHRVAVVGWFLDGGHIPQARQGHVQRPGDGGGRQGQHVHALRQLLELLLVGHAEALLLVDDEQPQVLEHHVLLQQLVGADDQVQRPGPQVCQSFAGLGGGAEAGQDADVHRKTAKTADGGGVMLLGQNRGGHQDGHLLAVQNGLHGGAESHLRLAEAHVAAEQTVHGPGRFHVALDLVDGTELIVGLGVGEILFKFRLPGGVGGKGKAGQPLALRVELDQAPGQILGGSLGPGLGFLPLVAAQAVELDGGVLAAADVFADEVKLGGGNV